MSGWRGGRRRTRPLMLVEIAPEDVRDRRAQRVQDLVAWALAALSLVSLAVLAWLGSRP